MTILYRTQATAIGGRSGFAGSADGRLRVELSRPKAMGRDESGGDGGATNPEQLFAAGYAACFLSAIRYVAAQLDVAVAPDSNVTACVGIGPADEADDESLVLSVTLSIDLPGLDTSLAERVAQRAHAICPYSKAIRGNVAVILRVG